MFFPKILPKATFFLEVTVEIKKKTRFLFYFHVLRKKSSDES